MKPRLTGLIFAVLFTACGSSAGLQPPAAATATSASTATSAATAAPLASASASSTTGSTTKVSANNATNVQLVAAFTAAGIPNASSWAREVQEYRPYDAGDANLTKLRQNLAKYNPAAGVVDKIVATLSLP